LVLSNPTLPEITDGYEIQLHHSLGHDRFRSPEAICRPLKIGGRAANAGFPTPFHFGSVEFSASFSGKWRAEPFGP
jgi:hypothetical protein